jgi:phosphoribosyl 1,2-cyclic phosphate phosphodiesterase
MKITVLGSGATQTIPRPCCNCRVCREAREKGVPYARGGPSIFIAEGNILVDTPPDIANLLNREKITKVENVFYTHWHPDHTLGFFLFEQMNWDWKKLGPRCKSMIYFPNGVYQDLKSHNLSGVIDYAFFRKLAEKRDLTKVKIGKVEVSPIRVSNDSNTYGFMFEEGKKRVLYAPCDISDLKADDIKDIDMAIVEMGRFNNPSPGFTDFLKTLKTLEDANVKRKIMTHIEENRQVSYDDAKKLEKKYNVKFAYDGMKLEI